MRLHLDYSITVAPFALKLGLQEHLQPDGRHVAHAVRRYESLYERWTYLYADELQDAIQETESFCDYAASEYGDPSAPEEVKLAFEQLLAAGKSFLSALKEKVAVAAQVIQTENVESLLKDRAQLRTQLRKAQWTNDHYLKRIAHYESLWLKATRELSAAHVGIRRLRRSLNLYQAGLRKALQKPSN